MQPCSCCITVFSDLVRHAWAITGKASHAQPSLPLIHHLFSLASAPIFPLKKRSPDETPAVKGVAESCHQPFTIQGVVVALPDDIIIGQLFSGDVSSRRPALLSHSFAQSLSGTGTRRLSHHPTISPFPGPVPIRCWESLVRFWCR
jgi:hypothetical protein